MAQRPRHQPERSCVVCRSKRPKQELTRLVLGASGRLSLDALGRAPGRGAYLCGSADCWQRAATGRAVAQALRTDLSEADRALLRNGLPESAIPASSGTESTPASR